jgi:Transposase DDE domain
MQTNFVSSGRRSVLFQRMREGILAAGLRMRHRRHEKDFTRERVLTFPVVMLLLLQKTARSAQRHLQSFLRELSTDYKTLSVTAGGWTQARAKLLHTAFIELNQSIVLPEFYAPDQAQHCRRWRGHRMLGVDGSQLWLPDHPEVVKEFGVVQVANHLGPTGTRYVPGRLSIIYDLLNEIGLDARLEPVSRGEVEVALAQLVQIEPKDVLIWDRGYTGFILMAQVRARGAHFVGRCSKGSFAAAQQLFRVNRAGHSQVTRLYVPKEQRAQAQQLGLPMELTVRFVSVRLPSGELEVLVTSLLEELKYPTEDFLEVYHWRWNQETYHQMLKGRLDLENWSGQTLEAVRQDVQVAVLVSNLESLLSQEVQEELSAGDAKRMHPAQVNRANSYHALKGLMLELLWSRKPVDKVILEIQSWMRQNPVSVRSSRPPPPRRKASAHRSYHYQRHLKKTVF